jgi:hypothetical protein
MIFKRYECKSLAITVNQLFSDWEQVFPEVTMSHGRRNSTLFACLKTPQLCRPSANRISI